MRPVAGISGHFLGGSNFAKPPLMVWENVWKGHFRVKNLEIIWNIYLFLFKKELTNYRKNTEFYDSTKKYIHPHLWIRENVHIEQYNNNSR